MRRGEVWWTDLPEPWGHRPALLLSRDEAYGTLTWVTAAPLTTRIRAARTQVPLDPLRDGVPLESVINLDNILAVRPAWLERRVALLRPEKMEEVDRVLHFALGIRNCPPWPRE